MRLRLSVTTLLALLLTLALTSMADGKGKGANKHEKIGTSKSERMVGTNKSDAIWGKGGSDTLKGKNGADRLYAGNGADRVFAGNGNDKLKGGKGRDLLQGGKSGDKITAAKGADRVKGGQGADVLRTGKGDDLLRADDRSVDRVINAGPGADVCVIDTALELKRTRGCEEIRNGSNSPSADDQGQNVVEQVRGIVCPPGQSCQLDVVLDLLDSAPIDLTDPVIINPDALLSVGGLTGVTVDSGLNLSVDDQGHLLLNVNYSCQEDGSLRVELFNDQIIDIPIYCKSGEINL